MRLVGTVLGGAFTSRLNHLIREVRGYTYGMRAEYGMPGGSAGSWSAPPCRPR